MLDQTVGAAIRAVRLRLGLRQSDVAARAGVAMSVVSEVERGHLDDQKLAVVRRVAAALDVRVDMVARWRGGELGRVLDTRHAALHEAVARRFAALAGWLTWPEVTFAIYGERGVIDILAWHAASGSLLIIELKTQIVDVGDLIGTLDRKVRLAMRIAAQRELPAPARVSRWVIVAEGPTNRRHVRDHAALLRSAYPDDGRRMVAWLRMPDGVVEALSFMPYVARADARRSLTAVQRVSRHKRSVDRVVDRAAIAPERARRRPETS